MALALVSKFWNSFFCFTGTVILFSVVVVFAFTGTVIFAFTGTVIFAFTGTVSFVFTGTVILFSVVVSYLNQFFY